MADSFEVTCLGWMIKGGGSHWIVLSLIYPNRGLRFFGRDLGFYSRVQVLLKDYDTLQVPHQPFSVYHRRAMPSACEWAAVIVGI
jgi:hypothetical protein